MEVAKMAQAPQVNYFCCKVCGKLNDLDSGFCDIYHKAYYRAYQEGLRKWMSRKVVLPDYEPSDWEQSFLPFGKGGVHPDER
jgi:hypothetical protein